MVYNNSIQAAVTGDSTVATIVYDTTVYDTTSSFNTTTNTFTAPLTGKYQLSGAIQLTNIDVINTAGYIYIVSTALTYYPWHANPSIYAAGNGLSLNYNALIPLTAGDTLSIAIRIDGNAVLNVGYQNSQAYTWFSGYMVAGI